MYPALCLGSLSRDLYTKFVENLKRLTCAFGTQAALEEEVCILLSVSALCPEICILSLLRI